MMNRRTYIAGAGTATLAGLAGCLGVLGMDNHDANPIGISGDAASETGYELYGVEELGIDEEFDLGLWTERVSVMNYVAEYDKRVTIEPLIDERAATFVVLSTPQISVIGQQVNPVEDMGTAELVELIADNYDDVGNVEHVEDDELPVMGTEVPVSTFTADATFSGNQSVTVNLHVSEAVETDDDLVVGIGVYPRDLESQERSNVETLLSAIDPDVNPTNGDDGANDGSDSGGDDGSNGDDDSGDDDGNSDDGGDDDGDDDGGIGLGL